MKLSFKAYKRKLKIPIIMSRGLIDYREGVILRLESDRVSFSEAVILDYFKTETLEQSLAALTALPANVTFENLKDIPENYLATRFAFEALFLDLEVNRVMQVSKLLPAGEAAIDICKNSAEQGYHTFKWKIGSFDNEFEIFEKLLLVSKNSKFRLDANAGLSSALAEKWFRFAEGKAVEFIEQPLPVEMFEQMLKFSQEFSTPIALDESVARFDDVLSVQARGWKGIYVIKPSRLGKLKEFLKWRESNSLNLVYSSALESAFGTEVGLRIAASDRSNDYALGYGVSDFFEKDGLDLYRDRPKINVGSIKTEELEILWSKISS